MNWYSIFLWPFALIYGTAVTIRNSLYKAKILRSHQVNIPTICVGNLAVGGTGKTPFVEYLITMLQKDYRVAVLSRGYGRSSHGFVLADENATARTIGDEPMQIHSKFPNIPVAVCRNRVQGIKRLHIAHPDIQVVILDDAYQHRQLRCGFYILLTAYDNLYTHDHFLPMGRLRDARHESLRAKSVVITKCPETMKPIDQRVVENRLHLPAYQQLYFSQITYSQLPVAKKVLLLTGIANPKPLYQKVLQTCPCTHLKQYADHHRYTNLDIQNIDKMAAAYDIVLTTEKDYMRLQTMQLTEQLNSKLQVVTIQPDLNKPENLQRQLTQYIKETLHSEK